LSNPPGTWVNGHVVDFRGGHCDRYALLVIEAFEPIALFVFDAEHISRVGSALSKRHVDMEHTLQLSQRNIATLCSESALFAPYGVQVFDLARG
jgi:hypothetical protein